MHSTKSAAALSQAEKGIFPPKQEPKRGGGTGGGTSGGKNKGKGGGGKDLSSLTDAELDELRKASGGK